MSRVYGYTRLKSVRELELFDEYQVNTGRHIDKMFVDVILGKLTTRKNLEAMLDGLKRDDMVILKTFTNVCKTFQEIQQLIRAVHQKGATIDILKKSSQEQYFCTKEGYESLNVLIQTKKNISHEPKVKITKDPEKEELLLKIYPMYLKYKGSEMSAKDISKELNIDEQLFYLYARSLN